ncbi:hypothetical protein NDU88_004641 [Pleurodeles waltl]|uniref:Uncharacterized protein n=1 Tax=Pleurodeles waltl TaxID=8319 RepID=A0AAV7L1J5_PLEWA|nr:hypothetical protein NDU88_004641 [Pleurodeles waltl]
MLRTGTVPQSVAPPQGPTAGVVPGVSQGLFASSVATPSPGDPRASPKVSEHQDQFTSGRCLGRRRRSSAGRATPETPRPGRGPLAFRTPVCLRSPASPQFRPGAGEQAPGQGSPQSPAAHVVLAQGLPDSALAGMHLVRAGRNSSFTSPAISGRGRAHHRRYLRLPGGGSVHPRSVWRSRLSRPSQPLLPQILSEHLSVCLASSQGRARGAQLTSAPRTRLQTASWPPSDSDFLRLFGPGGCSGRGALLDHLSTSQNAVMLGFPGR